MEATVITVYVTWVKASILRTYDFIVFEGHKIETRRLMEKIRGREKVQATVDRGIIFLYCFK
jgi:hypothetical protein